MVTFTATQLVMDVCHDYCHAAKTAVHHFIRFCCLYAEYSNEMVYEKFNSSQKELWTTCNTEGNI